MNSADLLTLGDFERAARNKLDDAIWAYVAGGAGEERTIRANLAAFDEVWLRRRIASDRGERPQTAVSILGSSNAIPVLLAPTSPVKILHPDAELACGRAARKAGVTSIVSTDTHYSFPEIRAESGSDCWFQLYAYRSRDDVEATVDMAISAGAKAIVVTMDADYAARRISTTRAQFKKPADVDFGTLRALGIISGETPAGARLERLPLGWDDIEWIRRRTSLPLVVKGVVHPDDARRAFEMGVDAIIVSNHGGRQLDCATPSLVALQEIVGAVGDAQTVLFDSGIRSGVDVVKAIALGADAVCIGRPYLWGLSIGGQQGVELVLELLAGEIEDTLLQMGLSDIAAVGPDCIAELRWSPGA